MKKKLTFKIWVLIFVLFFSLLSIFSFSNLFQKGVLVTSVEKNSTAFEQGFRQGQIIQNIDGIKINSKEDYSKLIQEKFPSNEEFKTIFKTKELEIPFYSNSTPQITVSDLSITNIKTGLDLSGGSRALVQAKDKKLSSKEINDLVDITSNKLNVYGISDVDVQAISDLEGNNFMLVQIAGASAKDLKKLIEEQGKFEAKIGNETVFIGGNKDIASVARSGQQAGIESCQASGKGEYCNFRFTIYLSEQAAKRQASITEKLKVNQTPECIAKKDCYLEKSLDLYVDDKFVSSLRISEGLKGSVTTQISISGSGSGDTRDDAYKAAEKEMKNLQTVLITGSLPYKLKIVKLDTISPTLGDKFVNYIFFAGIMALIAVGIVIFLRYKNFKVSLAVLLTSSSEIIIILGVASLISWNLDLPSIAGILATIGTGVDDQIIILDESKQGKSLSLKQRLKRAFGIIMGSYATSLVSLLPLLWAGAGLLKGFAITTIIGISAGVFITRPAFADIIKRMRE